MPFRRGTGLVRRNRPRSEADKKALKARRERKEKNIREQKEAAAGRVSYVKKPFSGRSCICIGLAAAALLLGYAGFYFGVMTRGQAALNAGALGLCSILCCLVSAAYGAASFQERDRKYILARLGLGIDGVLLIVWIVIIIIGVRS